MLLLQYAQFVVCLDAIAMRAYAECALSQLAAFVRQAKTQVIQRWNVAHGMQASQSLPQSSDPCPAGDVLVSCMGALYDYVHACFH